MNKIIINNTKFDFNIGCRLLKLKYAECPTMLEDTIGDFWNEIVPMTFQEIAKDIRNLEERRVAIDCLGIERLYEQVNPKLVGKETIKKTTTWVNAEGNLETIKFKDTYELYRVKSDMWSKGTDSRGVLRDVCFIKCKDTSTDRNYFIWVDAQSVYATNDGREQRWFSGGEDYISKINPIQAIAWTIQTNIDEGGIEKIVRQGDCVLIKKNKKATNIRTRHLTEKEYRELLVLES